MAFGEISGIMRIFCILNKVAWQYIADMQDFTLVRKHSDTVKYERKKNTKFDFVPIAIRHGNITTPIIQL